MSLSYGGFYIHDNHHDILNFVDVTSFPMYASFPLQVFLLFFFFFGPISALLYSFLYFSF